MSLTQRTSSPLRTTGTDASPSGEPKPEGQLRRSQCLRLVTPTPCPVSSRQRSAEWASQAAGNVCLAAGTLPARAASGVPVPRRDS